MNPITSEANHGRLDVRGARASTVIVHRVPADCVERFLEWQRGLTESVKAFPGYQATDLYPATDSKRPEWVAVLHFDTPVALQSWLDSPVRAEWMAKVPKEVADIRLKTLTTGFGPWFAGLVDDGQLPPHWKMALSVLLPLYPIVMLLTLFLSPHLKGLGLAVSLLIGNAASICILEWIVMPILRELLGPWLRANGLEGRTVTFIGLVVILGALGALTLLFYQLAG